MCGAFSFARRIFCGRTVAAGGSWPWPVQGHRTALTFEFQLVLALWIRADRRARGFGVPFEFDTFVFFAWPLVLPHYLLRTRDGSGLFSAAGIYGLYLMPDLAAVVTRVALGR
jgi:hypothetical protein